VEFETAPNNIVAFFQDPRSEKGLFTSQPKGPLDCGFIVRIRLAMQKRDAIGVL
jgi:hypothetical protein